MTVTQNTTIRQTVEINAPAQAVFDALTQPVQLLEWWNDEPNHAADSMTNDLRVGGAWRIEGHRGDGSKFWMHGEYTVVQPPTLVEYTWIYHWAPEGSEPTVVRFELAEVDGRTTLQLTHSGFADTEGYEGHNEGWGDTVLPLLRAYLER